MLIVYCSLVTSLLMAAADQEKSVILSRHFLLSKSTRLKIKKYSLGIYNKYLVYYNYNFP